jgi:hypothetical protein
MEFPPEIVSIIREYSMPPFYPRIQEGPVSQECFRMARPTRGSPHVLPALLAFETAFHVFEPVRGFYEEDPEEWFHAELNLDFYHKQTYLRYCETELSRLIENHS